MEPADTIGRVGFRRWHERQLIEGHAWFVSAFLCLIAVFACMEELQVPKAWPLQLALLACIVGAGAVGAYGLLRYMKLLTQALRLGEHATCRACGTYARFTMISATRARCSKCANEWRLID